MPFDESRHIKQIILEEKQQKVARMKEEKRFIQCMRHDFKLSNMQLVRKQLLEEKHSALLDAGVPKSGQVAEVPPEVPMRCVTSFSIQVASVESTHGGASLWTGEADGSIGVRNGVTGALVYQIDAPALQDGCTVPAIAETLFAVDSHMWAGFSDGTIRIFDQQVFILAFEGKLHRGGVTAFAQSFDGKTFSASKDGTVGKWDTEENNFDSLSQTDPIDGSPAALCLATYGYHLFVGYSNGTLRAYDIETGDASVTFQGQDDAVTGVCVQDGFLFSTSLDGSVVAWNIANGEAIKRLEGHRAPVTAMMCDQIGHRIWTTDTDGVINVWSSQSERGFQLEQSVAHDEAVDIVALKGIAAIDAVKVWTLGSNGQNKVWHSSTNLVEESIRDGLRAMRSIIDQDEIELRKWNELIRTLHEVAYRLRTSLSDTLDVSCGRELQRRAYLVWKQWVLKSQLKKFQGCALQHVAQRANISLRQRTFATLLLNRNKQRRLRYTTQLSNLLLADTQRELIYSYGKKMEAVHYTLRRLKRARSVAAVSEDCAQRLILRRAFEKFCRFRRWSQESRQRVRMAGAICAAAEKRLGLIFFRQWMSRVQLNDINRQKVFHSIAIASTVSKRLSSSYFAAWKSYVDRKKRQRLLVRLQTILSTSSMEQPLGSYFGKWKRYSEQRLGNALVQAREALLPESQVLERKMAEVEHLLRRRRLLDDASEAIRLALLARDEKLAHIEELKQQNRAIEDKIEAKRQGKIDAITQSIQQQVADLIARLKCKLINFNGDFALMTKVGERSKRLGAIKNFLEAHQAVKRVVVEMTHIAYLPMDEEWPLKLDMIRKMKSHHTENVLTAIKTMIITYDIMTPIERSSLQTDQEIVLNAAILQQMADHCVASKNKRLGGRK